MRLVRTYCIVASMALMRAGVRSYVLGMSRPLREPLRRCFQSLIHTSGTLDIVCASDRELEDLGKKLSIALLPGDVVFLQGDLGAGKTTLSRGIVRGKFDEEDMVVTSPSYLLDNTYQYGHDQYIHHMDLYRLPVGYPDMGMLGIPDIFSSAICIIEWPDRLVGGNIPSSYLDVHIAMAAATPAVATTVNAKQASTGNIAHKSNDVLSEAQDTGCGPESVDSEGSDADEAEGEEQEQDAQPARLVTLRFVGDRWLKKATIIRKLLLSGK